LESISRAIDDPAAATQLFREVVEPLSDSFERRAVDQYAQLFKAVPGCDFWRFQRARQPRRCIVDAADIVVLSRITLGADVAVTSVILDAAKKRFPSANIWFAGPMKNYELFAADSRIQYIPVNYPRKGSIRERVSIAQNLQLPPDALVIDPDSRITQLGLVSICLERDYYFFESRSYGEETSEPLPRLAASWCRETFGVTDARSYIAPLSTLEGADIAVSLGTGGNESKHLSADFEKELLVGLSSKGTVLIDRGAGGEEAERVNLATAGLPNIRYSNGSFAEFAGAIARSKEYVGYDSSGQHIAAACGIPLTVYFTGLINEKFRHRWHPYGPGKITVHNIPPEQLQ